MMQAYIEGRDLYAFMACRVFTRVAAKTAESLNGFVSMNRLTEEEDLDTLTKHLAPLKRQMVTDGFIYRKGMTFYAKDIKAEDCYDGTVYRKTMKTLLLAMMYSMSTKGLAARLKIEQKDAEEIMANFFQSFPKIKETMKRLEYLCKKDGYVTTEWGRKRRLPGIWSEDSFIRFKTIRQILNSKIQGGAADIMKLAMIKVGYDPRIKELGGKLLLTVHDELIVEAPKENALAITELLIEDMSGAVKLKVPMKVDAEIFVDGRWYGESVVVKRKGEGYVILNDGNEITPDELLDCIKVA